MRPWSEAAHRTPPGSSALRESEASATKRPVGTEINPTLYRRALLYLIGHFNVMEIKVLQHKKGNDY
ncbi:hypothetical protein [Lysinibacillus xylanilyticus]|uniref:hypothetical protein n=1 Tax=Lysinibacillus xylanilyticus TaxID=582475 RepID=UPI003D039CBE